MTILVEKVFMKTLYLMMGFLIFCPLAQADPLSADPAAPALGDLGFSPTDLQSDPEFQKQLEIRSDMLHVHQVLGLVTAVPLLTTYVLGLTAAGNVEGGGTDTGLHAALGITTTGLYLTTASFAIFAPKPEGLKASGSTQVHETLAWIHAPLMIITPLLGDMVNDRVQNHQPLGDLGTIHFIAATTLVTSYLAALVVETLNL